jgi:hypothetical protein
MTSNTLIISTTTIIEQTTKVHRSTQYRANPLLQEFRDFLARYPEEFVVTEEIVYLKEYEGKITNTFRKQNNIPNRQKSSMSSLSVFLFIFCLICFDSPRHLIGLQVLFYHIYLWIFKLIYFIRMKLTNLR